MCPDIKKFIGLADIISEEVNVVKKKRKKQQSFPNDMRNRKKKNLTFNEDIWTDFKQRCEEEGRPMSRVLERLMERYIDGEIGWDD